MEKLDHIVVAGDRFDISDSEGAAEVMDAALHVIEQLTSHSVPLDKLPLELAALPPIWVGLAQANANDVDEGLARIRTSTLGEQAILALLKKISDERAYEQIKTALGSGFKSFTSFGTNEGYEELSRFIDADLAVRYARLLSDKHLIRISDAKGQADFIRRIKLTSPHYADIFTKEFDNFIGRLDSYGAHGELIGMNTRIAAAYVAYKGWRLLDIPRFQQNLNHVVDDGNNVPMDTYIDSSKGRFKFSIETEKGAVTRFKVFQRNELSDAYDTLYEAPAIADVMKAMR